MNKSSFEVLTIKQIAERLQVSTTLVGSQIRIPAEYLPLFLKKKW